MFIMTLDEYLKGRGIEKFSEGYSQQVEGQVKDIIEITNKPDIKVMEIGFNAGHSAELMLENNKTLNLTSFDLGQYNYVLPGKEYINHAYPGRHTLYLGDSTMTIPAFTQQYPDVKFDVIFIDGGHLYPIAKADIENCFHLAHKDTIVMLDDTMYTKDWEEGWTIGPTKAWLESLDNGKITELDRKDYMKGRGMSWGRYIKD
jgi:hypothetical protein